MDALPLLIPEMNANFEILVVDDCDLCSGDDDAPKCGNQANAGTRRAGASPAGHHGADGGTSVSGVGISIVAGFNHGTDVTVATARIEAGIGAGVGVVAVTVVAGLRSRSHITVSADGILAVIRARVRIAAIAVVTLFVRRIARREIRLDDAVAARGGGIFR